MVYVGFYWRDLESAFVFAHRSCSICIKMLGAHTPKDARLCQVSVIDEKVFLWRTRFSGEIWIAKI